MNQPARISIIDDDESVRRALSRLCKSAGYEVQTYASAEEFLSAANTGQTDLLVLDVHLPGDSGLKLQSDLRAADEHIPTVFVTAYDDDQARRQAIENGAAEFLRKPLDTARLLSAIEKALH